MKNIAAMAAVLGLLSITVPSASVLAAGQQDFSLLNKTGYEIKEVYVSSSASNNWEEDVLGRDVLKDGKIVNISFHSAAKGCKWDLKVVYSDDNSSAVWRGFDLCKITKVTIRYNRKTDTTSAVTE